MLFPPGVSLFGGDNTGIYEGIHRFAIDNSRFLRETFVHPVIKAIEQGRYLDKRRGGAGHKELARYFLETNNFRSFPPAHRISHEGGGTDGRLQMGKAIKYRLD